MRWLKAKLAATALFPYRRSRSGAPIARPNDSARTATVARQYKTVENEIGVANGQFAGNGRLPILSSLLSDPSTVRPAKRGSSCGDPYRERTTRSSKAVIESAFVQRPTRPEAKRLSRWSMSGLSFSQP